MINLHVLVPVWGKAYIDSFMRAPFSSFFSPGNVPSIVDECRVTFVFLTLKDSSDFILECTKNATFFNNCKIKFVYIDDLVAGDKNYSIPLTLAFVRGIVEEKENMVNTYFILFNADFLLSDGALKTVLKHINNGSDVVMATSFRCNEEKVRPWIEKRMVDGDPYCINPRDAVRVAIDNIHITVSSRVVNQKIISSEYWNQLYWRVDDSTYIARYFLATQFCVKPTTYKKCISSFMDYSFIEEFCPNGVISFCDDSDEFFLLELQKTMQEIDLLRIGGSSIQKVSASIANWATQYHVNNSKISVAIHSSDLPVQFSVENEKFSNFLDNVYKRIGENHPGYFDHHHWIGAVASWMEKSCLYAKKNKTVEMRMSGLNLRPYNSDAQYFDLINDRLNKFLAYLWGSGRKLSLCSPLWRDFFCLKKELGAYNNCEDILYICDNHICDPLLSNITNVKKIFLLDFIHGILKEDNKKFKQCFISLSPLNADLLEEIHSSCSEVMEGGGEVIMFIGSTALRKNKRPNNFLATAMTVYTFSKEYEFHLKFIGNTFYASIIKKMINFAYENSPRYKKLIKVSVCSMLLASLNFKFMLRNQGESSLGMVTSCILRKKMSGVR